MVTGCYVIACYTGDGLKKGSDAMTFVRHLGTSRMKRTSSWRTGGVGYVALKNPGGALPGGIKTGHGLQ